MCASVIYKQLFSIHPKIIFLYCASRVANMIEAIKHPLSNFLSICVFFQRNKTMSRNLGVSLCSDMVCIVYIHVYLPLKLLWMWHKGHRMEGEPTLGSCSSTGTCSPLLSALWFTRTLLPNLGGADFHSIVQGLPYSAILFPVEEQEVLPAAVPSTVN